MRMPGIAGHARNRAVTHKKPAGPSGPRGFLELQNRRRGDGKR
jgi:hypothetical protein